ncbi:PREDICTED: tachykinin-like peptides receptor 86C [Acropora digitifera]|uniref:tachykinin-like peptides receptor 86C n=1 Tax=Acropora digitifera TaxID=70779 RepID=UPI00077AC6A0|nr:PREDICTED: tachykinin-like peptides receptor 86C [Acropora digitifera]
MPSTPSLSHLCDLKTDKMETNTTRASLSQDIIFASLYSFIVIFGIIGNCLVITVVRKTPSMHTTTNYLLMNLAVADVLTLLLCPGVYDFALTSVRLQGFSGDLICKLFVGNAIVPITINAGVLTVCTIAVERYFALVKPFHTALRMSKSSVRYVVVIVWIIAVLSCIPDIQANTFNTSVSSRYPCMRPWTLDEYAFQKPHIIFTCVCFGFTSSLVVLFCYTEIIRGLYITKTICSGSTVTEAEKKEKKQLALLLVWLSIVFAFCSLPFAIFFTFLVFTDSGTVQNNYELLYILHRISRFLLSSNSFFNPILYAWQSTNYRSGLLDICTCFKISDCISCFRKGRCVAFNAESEPKRNENCVALEMRNLNESVHPRENHLAGMQVA